jgi:hypothetical protein
VVEELTMSKTDEAAAKAIDKASQAADQIAAKMGELAQQYGPDVVNAAVEVARFTAAGNILSGAVAASIAFFAFRWGTARGARAAEICRKKGDEYWASMEMPHGFGCIVGFIAGAVCSGIAIERLASIWNWVGIFEPKLYIAHRVLEKLL